MKILFSTFKQLQGRPASILRSNHRTSHSSNQLHLSNNATMPLVVPGITSSGGKKDEWMNKLVGKRISDSSNETCFAKKDLPESHRIVRPGDFTTADHRPERLNIHVDENDNVRDVNYG
ncbi:hypothetical protein BJX64DRAFT_265869 [Aspergillus heterothallicus]